MMRRVEFLQQKSDFIDAFLSVMSSYLYQFSINALLSPDKIGIKKLAKVLNLRKVTPSL